MHIFNEVEIPPTFIPNKSTPGTTVGVVFAFLKCLTFEKKKKKLWQKVILTVP